MLMSNDNSGVEQLHFRVVPEPPREQWTPTEMTYRVEERDQLWNVFMKSTVARIEIPEVTHIRLQVRCGHVV